MFTIEPISKNHSQFGASPTAASAPVEAAPMREPVSAKRIGGSRPSSQARSGIMARPKMPTKPNQPRHQ